MALGELTDDRTGAGTTIQILLGFTGLDVLGDLRDVGANLWNWEWSWSHAGKTLLNTVALLPVVGLLKYADEVGSLWKTSSRIRDAAASTADVAADAMRAMDRGADSVDASRYLQRLRVMENIADSRRAREVSKFGQHLSTISEVERRIAAPAKNFDLPVLNPHFTPDPTKIIGSEKAYSVAFRTQLPTTAYPGRSRGFHFQEANRQLVQAMDADPQFAKQMESLIPGIRSELVKPRSFSRQPPTDWSWHHHADTGVVELVPRVQHEAAGPLQQLLHPGGQGGMNIWGL